MTVIHSDEYSDLVFDVQGVVSISMRGCATDTQWRTLRCALVALYTRLSDEDQRFYIVCDMTLVDLTLSQICSMIVLMRELRPILKRLNQGTRLIMSSQSKRFIELLLTLYTPDGPLEVVSTTDVYHCSSQIDF